MGEYTYRLTIPTAGQTVEEVLALHRQEHALHGNDIDLLTQSMMLIQAGHYREAMNLALQVRPLSSEGEVLPGAVDKSTAQAAFLAASERAQPLYEQAAREIEGISEGSHTMATYFMGMDMLRNDSNW